MARIALDASYLSGVNPTGIAIYTRRLIESLAALPAPHHFLLCYRLSRFRRPRDLFRPPARSGGPGFSVQLYQEPLTFWLPWRTDVFHSLAQRPPGFRFQREVLTIHDVFPISGPDYSTPAFQRRFSALLRQALPRAARILTLSEYTADQLTLHCGIGRERVRVIPGGVDAPAVMLPWEERLREREHLVGAGNEMLLTVGVLDNRKNVLNTLRALKLLPDRYRLVLAGGNGYGSEAIHDFISREGLESRVRWLGYVSRDRLLVLYQAASALLFASLEEGFGFPALEAMACGLPVVTSRASALPETCGDAAVYADPRDPSDIAAQAAGAVEDSALRQELIRKGLLRASQFTWARTAAATLSVYEEMLGC